ncbi:MAG: metal ABC transporter substrate-binding protein [Paracoccaceae bacterium]
MWIHRIIVGALAAAVAAAGARAEPEATVFAVNAPLAAFAERLGGDAVRVVFPVPEGRDPQFWRPTIAEISAAQRADLILLNGAGFAVWTTKASLPRARTVDTSRGFADRLIATETITHSHGPEGEHAHTGTAAFTWLDFAQAAIQAEAVADALARQLPEQAGEIEAARTALLDDLDRLDARAREIAAGLDGRVLIATHPRYQYFARAYGLRIESLEWEAGEAPSAAAWAEFDARVAETGAGLLLWETEPAPEAAAALAARGMVGAVFETGAGRGSEGFVARMVRNLDRLAEAAAALP